MEDQKFYFWKDQFDYVFVFMNFMSINLYGKFFILKDNIEQYGVKRVNYINVQNFCLIYIVYYDIDLLYLEDSMIDLCN